ncbi:MAG: hypothetical protein ACN4GM_02330 [Gammaproteobacteria bacterium]
MHKDIEKPGKHILDALVNPTKSLKYAIEGFLKKQAIITYTVNITTAATCFKYLLTKTV